MKKSFLTLLLAVSFLAGCSAKEDTGKPEQQQIAENYYQNELGMSEEEASEVADALHGSEEETEKTNDDVTETEDQDEEAALAFKLYEASPEWEEADSLYMPVQIDDMLLQSGITVAEVIEKMESSEVDYIYDINPDALHFSSKICSAVISRLNEKGEEVSWFSFDYKTPAMGREVKLGECIAGRFKPYEAAEQYTRWCGGLSIQDILSMTSSDVDALRENDFFKENYSGPQLKGEHAKFYKPNEVNYNGYMRPLDLMRETGNSDNHNFFPLSGRYVFEIDLDSGNVIGFYVEYYDIDPY